MERSKTTKECRVCGKSFDIVKSAVHKRFCCSRKCGSKWQSKTNRGERHPGFKPTKFVCPICGKILMLSPQRAEIRKYCSPKCATKALEKRIETICAFCGKTIYIQPCSKRPNNFCNMECRHAYDHKKNSFLRKCATCNNEFEVKNCEKEIKRYCSRKCFDEAPRLKGKFSSRWIRKEIPCDICDKILYIAPSQIKPHNFCSRECFSVGQSNETKGENSHLWKGGPEATKQRQRQDPKHVLNQRIRGIVNASLRVERSKKGRHWEGLVGYTTEQLMERLLCTMPQGYTWQDFMEGRLHIDHKIPVSAFNFSKPEHIDFERCWALENLQLLPQLENLKKGNKLLESFQPTFALEINN